MYYFEDEQLRVCGCYTRQVRNQRLLSNARFIIVQHLMSDAEQLVNLLSEAGADICAVLAKPYSAYPQVVERMRNNGFNVWSMDYSEDMDTLSSSLLASAVRQSKQDSKQIVILDIGGYFARALCSHCDHDYAASISGVIEDTTFGHHVYERVVDQIPVPVFSVARSALKRIEAKFVGRAAVSAIEGILKDLGLSLPGRNALVLGYGMIGTNVAEALSNHGIRVAVYDSQDRRKLAAFVSGFQVGRKPDLLSHADIIFSATGTCALTLEDMGKCKNNVVLASVGSRASEFDIGGLQDSAIGIQEISPSLMMYTLPDHRTIVVANSGRAVNFLVNSVPTEIMDLVLAEIVSCSLLVLTQEHQHQLGKVHEIPVEYLDAIARDWLQQFIGGDA